jgi:K(+)-stimulated pyrophosphate-energized sodium pump
MSLELIPIILGAGGLVIAILIFAMLSKMPAGSGKVKEIADAIHVGAMVFM